MKYTIKNFRQDFPDDKTCLAFIFKNRYPKGWDAFTKRFKKVFMKNVLHKNEGDSTCHQGIVT